jgi:hypothetical protein
VSNTDNNKTVKLSVLTSLEKFKANLANQKAALANIPPQTPSTTQQLSDTSPSTQPLGFVEDVLFLLNPKKQGVVNASLNDGDLLKKDFDKIRETVSYTELSNWIECQWRHKLKYLNGIELEEDGPSIHTEYGQVMHDALEYYLKERKFEPFDKIRAQLKSMLDPLSESALKNQDPETFIASVESVLQQVPAFMDATFGPEWKFYAAELPLFESIEGEPDKTFKGFVDAMFTVPKPETSSTIKRNPNELWIIDWKCSGSFWSASKVKEKQLQLVLYKHYVSKKLNIDPRDIRTGFVILKRSVNPSKNGNIRLNEVAITSKTIESALTQLSRFFASVRKGFFAKNKDSCKYCVYKGTQYCI